LRAPDHDARESMMNKFVADLLKAKRALGRDAQE
jgi:hypothetical protein